MPVLFDRLKRFRVLWEIVCMLVAMFVFGTFMLIYASKFIFDHSVSSLLLMIYEAVLVVFITIRNWPQRVSSSLYDWVIALTGTGFLLFLRPAGVPYEPMAFLAIQIIGIIVSMAGLFSLNKSYGTVPANRGIRTNGIYRFIRHPLYAGYMLSGGSFILMNLTAYNCAVFFAFICFQLLRIFAEERLLMQDLEYAAYAAKVRWRLLPLVW